MISCPYHLPSLYEPAFNDLTDSEESEEEEVEEEEEEVESSVDLSISAARAAANYREAGTRMEEEPEKLKVVDFAEHIDPEVEKVLADIDDKLDLPYSTADFQRVVLNCVGKRKSVVLVVECGSGKMDVALKGSLVMREMEKEAKGVTIVVQPLTSLMNEKMMNPIAKVAVLSMAQELTCVEEDEGGEKAVLSCTMADLLGGSFPVLIGHPESFDTPLGQAILSALQKANLLLLIVIDEFHQGGEGHWNLFRPVSRQFLS